MRSLAIVTIFALGFLLGSCTGENPPSTPLETFRTYTKAIKQKDTTTMKLLLSNESIKMHEQEAKAQGTTVDEIVKRETLFSETQNRVEYRNEKIDGNNATLEIRTASGKWETVPFVFENGQWKIDKKGYFDRIMLDIEESDRQAEERINSGRIGDPDLMPAAPAEIPSNANFNAAPAQAPSNADSNTATGSANSSPQ